jgi:hypothetical protein
MIRLRSTKTSGKRTGPELIPLGFSFSLRKKG